MMQSLFGKHLVKAIALYKACSLLPSVQDCKRLLRSFDAVQRMLDTLVGHRINTLLAISCGSMVCFLVIRFLSGMLNHSLHGNRILFDIFVSFPLIAVISFHLGVFSSTETTLTPDHCRRGQRCPISCSSALCNTHTDPAITRGPKSSKARKLNSLTPKVETGYKTQELKENLLLMIQEQRNALQSLLVGQTTTEAELQKIFRTLDAINIPPRSREKRNASQLRGAQSEAPVYTSTPDFLSSASTLGDRPFSRLFRNAYVPRLRRSGSYPTLKLVPLSHQKRFGAFDSIWPSESRSKGEILFLQGITGHNNPRPSSLTLRSPRALSDSGLSLNVWLSQLNSNDTLASSPLSSITSSKILTTSFWKEVVTSPRTASRDMFEDLKVRGTFFFDILGRVTKAWHKLQHQPWLWFKRNVFDNSKKFRHDILDLIETAHVIENELTRILVLGVKLLIGVCKILFWPQLLLLNFVLNRLAPVLVKDTRLEGDYEQHIIKIGTPLSSTNDALESSFLEDLRAHEHKRKYRL